MSGPLEVLARGATEAFVPYALAALGGIVSERCGLANVALEASMLAGAFAASAAAVAGAPVAVVVAVAFAVGASVGAIHALFAAWLRASSVVVGMALNLAAGARRRSSRPLRSRGSFTSPSSARRRASACARRGRTVGSRSRRASRRSACASPRSASGTASPRSAGPRSASRAGSSNRK